MLVMPPQLTGLDPAPTPDPPVSQLLFTHFVVEEAEIHLAWLGKARM